MFFNNCRLTNVSLIQIEIKHFEQVARCLEKTRKVYKAIIVYLHSQAQRFFAYVSKWSDLFSNCNNRRMTFAHSGILLSFMQVIDEYLVTLKDFDYSCSLGYINGQLRQKVNDVI